MHSEAATIGEIEAAIVVVGGAVVGWGTGGDVTTFVLPARRHFARSRSKCEKLPI